jgi:DNA-binding FadR family transcriptional regulator
MSRVPVLKPREVIRALERLGFVEVRQRGASFCCSIAPLSKSHTLPLVAASPMLRLRFPSWKTSGRQQ